MSVGGSPIDKMVNQMGGLAINIPPSSFFGDGEASGTTEIIIRHIYTISNKNDGQTREVSKEVAGTKTSSNISVSDGQVVGNTLVVSGVIGTKNGVTVCPQNLTWVYTKNDMNQTLIVNKAIVESMEMWQKEDGCYCTAFSFEMPEWMGPPINVLSGITQGFKGKMFEPSAVKKTKKPKEPKIPQTPQTPDAGANLNESDETDD